MDLQGPTRMDLLESTSRARLPTNKLFSIQSTQNIIWALDYYAKTLTQTYSYGPWETETILIGKVTLRLLCISLILPQTPKSFHHTDCQCKQNSDSPDVFCGFKAKTLMALHSHFGMR